MIRKIAILFLLFMGIQHYAGAIGVRDSVTISLEPYTDTTCPGVQLDFTAIQSNDTFSSVEYHWYTNIRYTGVVIDTFHTTDVVEGDSVYCYIVFFNSTTANLDSSRSNTIIVHRSSSIMPNCIISLIVGSNPDCAGHPLTFLAYPVNGGSNPTFQWNINNVAVPGATTRSYTHIYGAADTVSCTMIGNSTCSIPYDDTVTSEKVPIIHIHLLATVSIIALHNPICAGTRDTFIATAVNPGAGYSFEWYIDSTLVVGAIGDSLITNLLHDGSIVYCKLLAPDSCISDHVSNSVAVTMTVISLSPTSVTTSLIAGSNPGCLDSTVTFKGFFANFGATPGYEWYINGIKVATDTSVFDTVYHDGDILTFKVFAKTRGCYTHDTITSPPILMVRDSTPPYPWVSLIGNLLVANAGGYYDWYYSPNIGGPYTIVPGQHNQTYHPTGPNLGYYYCVKDTQNCFSPPSNIIYISLLKVNNVFGSSVKLYPNPTTGMLNIDFGNQAKSMKMDVYSMGGQGLLHEEITNQFRHETDLSYLPEGIYFIVLRDDEGAMDTYKIQIQK